MSETLNPNANINPTDAQAAFGAIRDQQRAMEWTGNPNDGPISAETFNDLDAYMNARPTEAVENTHEQDSLQDTDLTKMHNSKLVSKWAESEGGKDFDGSVDVTNVQDVVEEIVSRVASRDKESLEEKRAVLSQFLDNKNAKLGKTDADNKEIERDRKILFDYLDAKLAEGATATDAEPSLRDRLNDVPDQKPGEGLPWENPQAKEDFKKKSVKELFDDNNPTLPADLLKNGVKTEVTKEQYDADTESLKNAVLSYREALANGDLETQAENAISLKDMMEEFKNRYNMSDEDFEKYVADVVSSMNATSETEETDIDAREDDLDDETDSPIKRRTKVWNRVKKAGKAVTPTAIAVRTKNAIALRNEKEPMSRKKKIGLAIGILAAGAAGTYAAIKYGTPAPKHNEFAKDAVEKAAKTAQKAKEAKETLKGQSLTDRIAQSAAEAGNSGDTSVSIPVIRGAGFARTLESSGLVAPGKGAKVVEALDRAGYLEGDKIAGVGKRGGKIVNYFRGNGTGNYTISAEARKIIEEAQA